LEVTQILTDTVILAWQILADTGLDQWLFNGTSLQLLVPEEHIGAFADNPL
jgi:hypothetical protein